MAEEMPGVLAIIKIIRLVFGLEIFPVLVLLI